MCTMKKSLVRFKRHWCLRHVLLRRVRGKVSDQPESKDCYLLAARDAASMSVLLTNVIHVRENEIRAPSVQSHEDVIELDKSLEDRLNCLSRLRMAAHGRA